MKRFLLYILLIFSSLGLSAQDYTESRIDSLEAVYNSMPDDDYRKMAVCLDIAENHYSMEKMNLYAQRLKDLANHNSDDYYCIKALSLMGYCLYFDGDNVRALELYHEALQIARDCEMDNQIAQLKSRISTCYSYLGDFPTSDRYLYEALEYYESKRDSLGISTCLRHLAINYCDQKLWSTAEALYSRALMIDSLRGDEYSMSYIYQELGDMYLLHYLTSSSDPDPELLRKGREAFFQTMSLYYDEPYSIYSTCFSLSMIMYLETVINGYKGQKLTDAINYLQMLYDDGRAQLEKMDSESDNLLFQYPRINLLILRNRIPEARSLLDSVANVVMNDESLITMLPYLYIEFDIFHTAIGDYKNAYYYKSKFYEMCNDVASMEYAANSAKQLAETQFQLESKRREQERFRVLMYWVIGVSLFVLALVWEYIRKRRHNAELNEKNQILTSQKEEILQQKEEINAQKDELFERNEQISNKNKQITDSINYASLIQKAALPRHEEMQELFGDYFLIYRPLNIVAGDFYWASKVGRYHILVCADCTGHGVPGAFVSMLGVSLLNDVTANIADDTKAADILNVLREKLMKSLGQSKVKYDNGAVYSMDGMDLSMVMIDYVGLTLQFSGAYRPLWIWRDGEIIQYKPDKMPIGLYLGPEKNFTNHDIEIRKGDMLYMFSDGIPDQFGYTDKTRTACKHFSTKRLLALLGEIGSLETLEQKEKIENAVDSWKNGYKQLDDNILIGVRI